MSLADVNGTSLFYEVNGDGYALVLLHGFGAKKEVWMAQVGVSGIGRFFNDSYKIRKWFSIYFNLLFIWFIFSHKLSIKSFY